MDGLCSAFAPDPIFLKWFVNAPDLFLTEPLATVVRERLAFRDTLGRLARLGLARITMVAHFQHIVFLRLVPRNNEIERVLKMGSELIGVEIRRSSS